MAGLGAGAAALRCDGCVDRQRATPAKAKRTRQQQTLPRGSRLLADRIRLSIVLQDGAHAKSSSEHGAGVLDEMKFEVRIAKFRTKCLQADRRLLMSRV